MSRTGPELYRNDKNCYHCVLEHVVRGGSAIDLGGVACNRSLGGKGRNYVDSYAQGR